MAIRFDPSSPLIHATLHESEGVIFWGRTRPPLNESHEGDVVHVCRTYERLDMLSLEHYGDIRLGWVILRRNDIFLAPDELYEGRKIFIPTRDSLVRRGILEQGREF
jgi:hypothetical protein